MIIRLDQHQPFKRALNWRLAFVFVTLRHSVTFRRDEMRAPLLAHRLRFTWVFTICVACLREFFRFVCVYSSVKIAMVKENPRTRDTRRERDRRGRGLVILDE